MQFSGKLSESFLIDFFVRDCLVGVEAEKRKIQNFI